MTNGERRAENYEWKKWLMCGLVAGPPRALLIPKLRSHVAEFLRERSLERLRILFSPTCVGFSTGTSFVRCRLFLTVVRETSES